MSDFTKFVAILVLAVMPALGQQMPDSVSVDSVAVSADSVTFFGNPRSSISSAVRIPARRSMFWTSGTVPPVVDPDSPAGSRERYGDTKTQAVGLLERIRDQLEDQGLSLSDVVYLRVYIVPDRFKGGQVDFRGWFAAYAEFFGTDENPTKPARSTLAVSQLVSPDWLLEIEAFAVYPE